MGVKKVRKHPERELFPLRNQNNLRRVKMSEKQLLVDTLSAVHLNNGLVRLMFVGQDVEDIEAGKAPEKIKPSLKQCITMPLPGFIYTMTVIENFLKDDRLQEVIKKAKETGAFSDVLDLAAVTREGK